VRESQGGFPAPLQSHVFQNGSVLENTPGRIIGGLGVTGHDFRGRKDLAPMSARCIRKRTGGGGEPPGPCCGPRVPVWKPGQWSYDTWLRTMRPFTSAMAGNFSAWSRKTGNRGCPGCIFTGRH